MAVPTVGIGTLTAIEQQQAAAEAAEDLDLPDIIESGDDDNRPRRGPNIVLSIETIIISALIFIGILAWFEFLRSWFDNVFNDLPETNFAPIWHRLWYAIFITALVLILLYIVYRIFNPCSFI